MADYQFKMPELGEGLVEGEIVKWHVSPGDTISEDDVICEVQNDKAVVEVPAPASGKVKELKVEEGTVANVGDVLAVLEVEGDAASADAGEEQPGAEAQPETPLRPKPENRTLPRPRRKNRKRRPAEQRR